MKNDLNNKMTFSRHKLLSNGLLRKLVLGTAIAGSALFGAREAKATPVEWGSFTNIVQNSSQSNPVGQTVNYAANSVSFRDQNGNTITNNPRFSLVYFAGVDLGGGYTSYNAVGGLDGSGRSANGYFNKDDANYWGMNLGQTANQTEGNVDNGYWRMFVDVNGDGYYGTYDSDTGLFLPESGEEIASVSVSNFQGFQTGAGTLSAGDFSGVYAVPEPTTGVLTSLGIVALTLRWDISQCVSSIDISASGTNITNCTVFLLSKTNLTQTSWTTNVSVAITGAVTSVTTTNAAPHLFFKVTEKINP